jgi:hypothetical protein
MRQLLIILIVSLILISGCVQKDNNQSSDIVAACQQLCQQEKAKRDLSNGPCLSNKIAEGWVCDVAHLPRTEADNNPENQCQAFGSEATHFVEVDPDCNLIRKY